MKPRKALVDLREARGSMSKSKVRIPKAKLWERFSTPERNDVVISERRMFREQFYMAIEQIKKQLSGN